MVSSVGHCNDGSMLIMDAPSSLSYCNAPSLDFNTLCTLHVSHACVDSPCISCRNCLTKSHDDMPAISCCHDKNACISSSCCAKNEVGGQAVLGRQRAMTTPWLTERHGYDPTYAILRRPFNGIIQNGLEN